MELYTKIKDSHNFFKILFFEDRNALLVYPGYHIFTFNNLKIEGYKASEIDKNKIILYNQDEIRIYSSEGELLNKIKNSFREDFINITIIPGTNCSIIRYYLGLYFIKNKLTLDTENKKYYVFNDYLYLFDNNKKIEKYTMDGEVELQKEIVIDSDNSTIVYTDEGLIICMSYSFNFLIILDEDLNTIFELYNHNMGIDYKNRIIWYQKDDKIYRYEFNKLLIK